MQFKRGNHYFKVLTITFSRKCVMRNDNGVGMKDVLMGRRKCCSIPPDKSQGRLQPKSCGFVRQIFYSELILIATNGKFVIEV